MSDFSIETLRRISDLLDAAQDSSTTTNLLDALQQARQLVQRAPEGCDLLDGVPFEWIPRISLLTAYAQERAHNTSEKIQEAAKDALLSIAARATSPREVILALIERLHLMARALREDEALDADELEMEPQVRAIMEALDIVLPRLKSKKPIAFIQQVHEALLPVLEGTHIHHRPAFCVVLLRLVQTLSALGHGSQESQNAVRDFLAAVVLVLYQQQDQHLSLRLFQDRHPLLSRNRPAFEEVADDGHGAAEEERVYLLKAAQKVELTSADPHLDLKLQKVDASLGYFVLRCLWSLEHGHHLGATPLAVLMRAHQAQLIDLLLLALQQQTISPDNIYPLVELVSPIAFMHPHPAYRLVAFKTLSQWILELQSQSTADAFVLVQDLISSAPHTGLKAAVIGLVRELILAQPDGRLASPLVVTDIILPCFNWSQVQEGAKDQAEGFDWLNNESLVVQQLALLYFVIKVGGPTQKALQTAEKQLEKQLLEPLRRHLSMALPPGLEGDAETAMALARVRENLDRLDESLGLQR